MRQINITEAIPGMILARSIFNPKCRVLLAAGISLTEEYIRKLLILNINTLFITDGRYAGITVPEYLSIETQERALAILTTAIERVNRQGTFDVTIVSTIASDIVEELVSQGDITIHLTGIATHDNYTLSHSLNCAIYSALLAHSCGFSIPQIKVITCGALLHDMGKTEIDKEIINKPSRLTADEFTIIKEHPARGFNLLTKKRLELSSLVSHMAWQHHEKVDGSGYPRGLQGDQILNYARLLTIADVYEAISVHRPYRKAMEPQETYNIIQSGLGTIFDEKYGQIFLSKLAIYLPGMEVLLNTGEHAVVISIPPGSPGRPIIRLISHPDGTSYMPPKDICLLTTPAISILSTLRKKA